MASREHDYRDVCSGTRRDRSTMVQSKIVSHICQSVEWNLVALNSRIVGEVSRGADINSTYVASWPGFSRSFNRRIVRVDTPDTASGSRADCASDFR